MRATALLVSATLLTHALAGPSDYNATTHYGLSVNSLDTLLFEPRIVAATLDAETTEPDGRKRLSFQFTLHNPSGGYFEEPGVFFNPTPALPWAVEMVTPGAFAAELPPGSTSAPGVATTTTPLTFLIAAADAEAAKTAIFARQHLHLSARDLYRFDAPIHAADEAMQTEFIEGIATGDQMTIRFGNMTASLAALTPGCYLVHNPELFQLRGPAFDGEDVLRAVLTNVGTADEEAKTKAQRTEVLKVSSVTTNSETGEVTLTGLQVPMLDSVVSAYSKATHLDGFIGSIPRDPYNPPNGTSFHTAGELDVRRMSLEEIMALHGNPDYPPGIVADIRGLFNLHYPINDVEFVPGVRLDGELLFKGLSFQFDGAERDNQRNKWAYKLSNRFEFTLRLTVEQGIDLAELEKTLVNVPLPGVVVPVFQVPVTVTPRIWFKVGAAVSAGSKIQVPIQGAFDAGFVMAYDGTKPEGSQFTFDSFSEPVPMPLSKPSIGRLLHMEARAWGELALDLLFNETLGPGIAVRATGELGIRPLDSPWWRLDGDLDLKGRFALNLFGVPLLTAEAPPVHIANLFNKAADGPAPPSTTGPLERAEGSHIRWARSASWTSFAPTSGTACRVRGSAEDVYAVVNTAYPNTSLMRVNGKGELVWIRSINSPLQHVVGTLDGGVILGGCPNGAQGIRLLKYDANGNLIWDKEHVFDHSDDLPPQLHTARMLARDTGPATQELHIVGWRYRNGLSSVTDPFLYRCDGDGNVLEVKSYDSPDFTIVRDAAYTPDGGLIWCGHGKRSGDLKESGWLMKTDALGNHVWSSLTETFRGNWFHSVTSGPNGAIYTCGRLGLVAGTEYGAMQLTKHEPDGDLLAAVSLSESTDFFSPTDYAIFPDHDHPATGIATNPGGSNGNGFENWLPDSGNTVWDEGRRIVWTPGGLLVASTTGLAGNSAATVACLTEDFAARWFTAHEVKSSNEGIFDIVPTEDGILALGFSEKILPTLNRNSGGSNGVLLLKLPREGKCDLHPGTMAIHRYLQPGIHDHANNEEELWAYQPSISGQAPLFSATVNATASAGAPLLAHQFVATTVTHWQPLEQGDMNQPMSYAQWEDYWRLPSGSPWADGDGDLRSNIEEWFFGGDPLTAQPGPPALEMAQAPDGSLLFSFRQSVASSLLAPRLQTSTDPSGPWEEMTLPALGVSRLDVYTNEAGFSLPRTDEPRRFYRILSP